MGCFWTWQKGVFWGFNVIVVCFCVSAIVPKVLKMLVFFSQFWGFFWVASSCLFGFRRFGCFRVSCFCFSFWCWFCFCLFALFCFVVGCCSPTIPSEASTSANNYRFFHLWLSPCWITKVKAKESLWDSVLLCNCGLLLWIALARCCHHEGEWERKSRDTECERKCPEQTSICNHCFGSCELVCSCDFWMRSDHSVCTCPQVDPLLLAWFTAKGVQREWRWKIESCNPIHTPKQSLEENFSKRQSHYTLCYLSSKRRHGVVFFSGHTSPFSPKSLWSEAGPCLLSCATAYCIVPLSASTLAWQLGCVAFRGSLVGLWMVGGMELQSSGSECSNAGAWILVKSLLWDSPARFVLWRISWILEDGRSIRHQSPLSAGRQILDRDTRRVCVCVWSHFIQSRKERSCFRKMRSGKSWDRSSSFCPTPAYAVSPLHARHSSTSSSHYAPSLLPWLRTTSPGVSRGDHVPSVPAWPHSAAPLQRCCSMSRKVPPLVSSLPRLLASACESIWDSRGLPQCSQGWLAANGNTFTESFFLGPARRSPGWFPVDTKAYACTSQQQS